VKSGVGGDTDGPLVPQPTPRNVTRQIGRKSVLETSDLLSLNRISYSPFSICHNFSASPEDSHDRFIWIGCIREEPSGPAFIGEPAHAHPLPGPRADRNRDAAIRFNAVGRCKRLVGSKEVRATPRATGNVHRPVQARGSRASAGHGRPDLKRRLGGRSCTKRADVVCASERSIDEGSSGRGHLRTEISCEHVCAGRSLRSFKQKTIVEGVHDNGKDFGCASGSKRDCTHPVG